MKELIITAIISFFVFSSVHFFNKNKKPFKRAFVSLLIGPFVLLVLDILSSVTGVMIPLSQLSFAVSTALGVPGVSLLVIMNVLI